MRIKPETLQLIDIKDWPHANQLVKEIGDIQREIESAENQAQKDMNIVKADLETRVKVHQARQNLLTKSLEEFALGHTKDFGEARSRKLDFGTLGWRKSTVIKVAGTTLEFIKSFFSPAKQKTVLHIKETVDKEALAKLTDDELAGIKARRKIKDVFFVEPLSVKAADKLN